MWDGWGRQRRGVSSHPQLMQTCEHLPHLIDKLTIGKHPWRDLFCPSCLDFCETMSSFDDHPPDGMDINADQRGRIIGSCVAIFVITDISVLLRLVSRKLARAGYWVRIHHERCDGEALNADGYHYCLVG